jgi:hypothetical protein
MKMIMVIGVRPQLIKVAAAIRLIKIYNQAHPSFRV